MVDLKQVVEGGERIRLKIRMSPGQEPFVIEAPSNMTVEKLETMLAKKFSRNPQNIRLTLRGQVLPRNATIGEIAEMIGTDGILENLPTHIYGY
ncbi:MAG: hypothetical protein QXI11_06190 [Thermoproteota archaeon]